MYHESNVWTACRSYIADFKCLIRPYPCHRYDMTSQMVLLRHQRTLTSVSTQYDRTLVQTIGLSRDH